MTFFWNKSSHPLQPCLFLDHRALVDDFFIIFCFNTIIDIIWAPHCTTLPRDGSLCSPMLHHITRVSGLFFPEFMWQFWLLFFDFSKRLDGCAMTWICQPALPGHQFALRVSLVEELLPLLSCTHPIHQRLQCVLEKMFCKEGWMINWVGAHWAFSQTVQKW